MVLLSSSSSMSTLRQQMQRAANDRQRLGAPLLPPLTHKQHPPDAAPALPKHQPQTSASAPELLTLPALPQRRALRGGVVASGDGARQEAVAGMVQAVELQARAICELHAPAPPYSAAAGLVAADAGLRVPGGWETIRVLVSVSPRQFAFPWPSSAPGLFPA